MEDVGGGGDGVGAEKEWQSAFFRCHDESPGSCRVAVDVSVYAWTGYFAFNSVGGHRRMHVVSVVESGPEHAFVGFEDGRFLCKLAAEVGDCFLQRAVEQPAHQAEGEYVAAFQHALVVKAAVGEGVACHLCDRHLQQAVFVNTEFGEGVVGGKLRFAQVGGAERVDVDYHGAASAQEAYVLF